MNKSIVLIISNLVIAATLWSRSAYGQPVSENWQDLKLSWSSPEPENTQAGTPIGNGHIGAKIKGGVGTEIIPLNDKWFWSCGPGLNPTDPKRRDAMLETRKFLAAGDIPGADVAAKGMWGSNEVGTFLPLGTLSIAFDHGDNATNYSRVLDLDRAMSIVQYTAAGVTYTRESFASFPDDVLVVRLSASLPGKISATVKLSFPPEMNGHGASVSKDDGAIVLRSRAPANGGWDEQKGMLAESRLRPIVQGGKATLSDDGTLRIEGADSVVLIVNCRTSFNGIDKEPGTQGIDPTPLVRATMDKAIAKGYDELFAAHIADYQPLFRRVWCQINGDPLAPHVAGFQFARYEMIASSRNGDRPHNQQGIWNNNWKPSSQSAHWLNENVQKYYSLIETANLPECGEPLWNWMQELATTGAKSAEIDWGFRGWVAGQTSDIWAKTTLSAGNNEWAIWPMGGVWLCENLYDHYAFSGDKKFLREREYPILKGAAEFCLDYLVENKDGYLITSPSTSPENRFALEPGGTAYAVTYGSTMDTALIRELFAQTVDASKTLEVDVELRTKLEASLKKLPPFKIGVNGELQEWYEDYSRLPADPRKRFTPHRHASHIVSVWPLSQITSRNTPELFAAAKLALENRGNGGYHPDKGAMWARLHDGDKAIASGDTMPVGNKITGTHPPKYAAFPELFLQSHTDAIELLPALPTGWKSGRVSGLRARGGYEVSIDWAEGKVTRCNIISKLGTMPVVRENGAVVDLKNDNRFKIVLERQN